MNKDKVMAKPIFAAVPLSAAGAPCAPRQPAHPRGVALVFHALLSLFSSCSSLRAVCALLLLAALAMPKAGAGYSVMGNDRILLMNNDKKLLANIKDQSYYDTSISSNTYWVHDTTAAPVLTKYLLPGVWHTMYKKDGTRLWHLEECRAGSGTVLTSTRNYIPWTTTAISIVDGITNNIPVTTDGAKMIGSVVMRNTKDSCIYSPYYEEGIGTLYFDTVNAFKATLTDKLAVEFATNVTDEAAANGATFASVSNNYEDVLWEPLRVDVMTVVNKQEPTMLETDVEEIALQSSAGADGLFYRIRKRINYHKPIRFRIRRLTVATGTADAAGLILVDNIIASYPPMTAEINRYGNDYDEELSGASVMGCTGDFDSAFHSYLGKAMQSSVWISFQTNNSQAKAVVLSDLKLNYRWRYLNQIIGPWKQIGFNPASINSSSMSTSNVVANSGIPLTDGVGDIEYYFTAKISAPFYSVKDYALGVGYGSGWTEEITAITNRANYAEETPAGGHDYFVRIREGESDFEWVKMVAYLSEWDDDGETNIWHDVSANMELVSDHCWRYNYYVPTNHIGRELRVHFLGKSLVTNDVPFTFTEQTNEWWSAATSVPYLPFTVSCGSQYAGQDLTCVLDDASTHLMFEFNDHKNAFSVSHATYQNFNTWTDSLGGFRGTSKWNDPTNAVDAAGVSDSKQRYEASMSTWDLADFEGPSEMFDVDDTDEGFPRGEPFSGSRRTPDGWTAENGMFVDSVRTAPHGMSLQMLGRGLGSLAYGGTAVDGVDEVSFTAFIAQQPSYNGFLTYLGGGTNQNYGISAKLTMSQLAYVANKNPLDMSPLHPSVSLVGYHRNGRGCYELRFTRGSDTSLIAAIYKWQPGANGLTATLLCSNTLANAATDARGWPGASGGENWKQYTGWSNYLVPNKTGENAKNDWTCAYFSLKTLNSGIVHLEAGISSEHNDKTLSADAASLKKILIYEDASPGQLTKGTYGIGSAGCTGGFGYITIHEVQNTDITWNTPNIKLTGEGEGVHIFNGDWDYIPSLWRELGDSDHFSSGFSSVKPASQTLKLELADGGTTFWEDTGLEQVIDSYTTNYFKFLPRATGPKQLRLRTGGDAWDDYGTDVVVDDVQVSAWTAPNIESLNAKDYEWAYTRAVVEPAFDTPDKSFYSLPVGTNGFVVVFTNATGAIKIRPRGDLEIDRILVVGGGGSGGNVIGSGGGGGQVVERTFAEPIKVSAGTAIELSVGKGGGYDGGNNTSDGKAGGQSYIKLNNVNYSANGGGAGLGNGDRASRAGGSSGSNAGGKGGYGRCGGGAGAGGPGGDYEPGNTTAGGGTKAGETATAAFNAIGGEGGEGVISDITGSDVYYGGGGGGGVGWTKTQNSYGGIGGLGGGGNGGDSYSSGNAGTATAEPGTDGLGGGGGGGGGKNNNADKAARGQKGGTGCVIIRVKTGCKMTTFQPARAVAEPEGGYDISWYPVQLRSPYLEKGIGLVSVNYMEADANAEISLQICTNNISGSGYTTVRMQEPPGSENWNTLTNWVFRNLNKSGTLTYYLSCREPVQGLLRLVVPTNVVAAATSKPLGQRDPDYGKISLTQVYCYDEPALDNRSWWGWNIHTEGWNTDNKDYAYLTDSPNGLSGILNFSALKTDNTSAAAKGIDLSDPKKEAEYKQNNSFLQSPALTNGIGQVSFRARLFDSSSTTPGWITLWASDEPDVDQALYPQAWYEVTNFLVTAKTYQTFSWKTTDDNSGAKAIRLEINGSRNGRNPAFADWERTSNPSHPDAAVKPLQRVCLDEVLVSEPVAPQLALRDVRPFRSYVTANPICMVTNIASESEQPIVGESWGLQVTVEPQQMSEELDTDSIEITAWFYRGKVPWGYGQWKDQAKPVELKRVAGVDQLVFRSSFEVAESIMNPEDTPDTCWQYFVVARFKDKSGESHEHPLDSREWKPPAWYRGLADYNKQYGNNESDKFAGYTIIDSVSPKRAWLNEFNYYDDGSGLDNRNQFIELAVPQGADLTGWHICVANGITNGPIATFGYGDARVTKKTGVTEGVDCLNHYAFLTLRNKLSKEEGYLPEADGEWNNVTIASVDEGSFRNYSAYGLYLMRPSGVIEHEIVTEGYSAFSSAWDYNSATSLVAKLVAKEPSSTWFFAAKDYGAGSIGVITNHGESAKCWTNSWVEASGDTPEIPGMVKTPGKVNRLSTGVTQYIDPDWFLLPNGTNIWIYATVLGDHLRQSIGSVTDQVSVVIVPKGATTNIIYRTDSWYELGDVTVNGVKAPEAEGRAGRSDSHVWAFELKDVQETQTVVANSRGSSELADVGIDRDDRYYNAVMKWLEQFDDTAVYRAEHWDLSDKKVGDLDIKDMYWLNIPPDEPGWVLKAGMGEVARPLPLGVERMKLGADGEDMPPQRGDRLTSVQPVVSVEPESGVPCTNLLLKVTMMITNRNNGAAVRPGQLNGLEYDGIGSSTYDPVFSPNWTSTTFKIVGALQKPGVKDRFLPLRWFVFGPNSFDSNFQAVIEVSDPFLPSSPGSYYGWGPYRDLFPIFYKWRLDGDGAQYETTDMLKPDSTFE